MLYEVQLLDSISEQTVKSFSCEAPDALMALQEGHYRFSVGKGQCLRVIPASHRLAKRFDWERRRIFIALENQAAIANGYEPKKWRDKLFKGAPKWQKRKAKVTVVRRESTVVSKESTEA